MKKEIEGQLSIFDLFRQEAEPDTSQCEGCHYRNEGRYEVKDRYTWKYLCPGNATANWPHGTPMNVSAPLIMPDGCYYENNIVDGVPHIHCWKKKDAKRYIDRYEVKEALEEVIGKPFEYNVKFDEWQCKVKKVIYSFKMSSAEYHNKQTKEGDDIILLAADKNNEGAGGPCDSIDEAIEMFKKYIERFNEKEVVCGFSKHECNKEELWKVADDLDEFMCPHTCCRQCATKECGARCNGSTEPVPANMVDAHKQVATDKSNGWREPITCDLCDTAFGSIVCFERRGYFYIRHKREWLKGRDGQPMISPGNIICHKLPKEENKDEH